VKRRVRELFRRDPARLLPDHDVVVIAKPGAGKLGFHELADEIVGAVSAGRERPRRT
jgi:ribonuclease P protein component